MVVVVVLFSSPDFMILIWLQVSALVSPVRRLIPPLPKRDWSAKILITVPLAQGTSAARDTAQSLRLASLNRAFDLRRLESGTPLSRHSFCFLYP